MVKDKVPFLKTAERARKAEVTEIFQEVIIKLTSRLEVVDVASRKVQILDVTDNVIQSNVHGIAIVKRHFPEESLKHCPAVAHPLLPVGLHHAELVGIGVQSKAIIWIIKFHCSIFPSIWLTKR